MSEEKTFSQARSCCFTLNNYTEEEFVSIKSWKCSYLVVGKEVGENGTPHLQGYVEWSSPKKFSTLKKLNGRIHWELRRGTSKQASDYCKKDGNFYEAGEINEQGSRSDLNEVTKYIMDNRPTPEMVMMAYPVAFAKYHKSLSEMCNMIRSKPRTEKPRVFWLWGKAGTGKTRAAMSYKPDDTYVKDGTKWWNGYHGQSVIVIDDMVPPAPNTTEYRSLLRWIDRYQCQVELKGAYVHLNSPVIFITSEYAPEDKYMENTLEQLIRRLDRVLEVKEDTEVLKDLGL